MTEPRAFRAIDTSLPDESLLLEASAGTGKTWSLTTIATRLVVEGRLESIDRLMMVTFTKAATHELRHRFRGRLREARDVLRGGDPGEDAYLATLVDRADREVALKRVRDALAAYDLVRISTIHSFCARVLQDSAFEAGLGFDVEDSTGSDRLRTTALADAWRAVVHGGSAWRAAWATVDGFTFDWARSDFDTFLRRPGATYRPLGSPLTELDARLADAWTAVFADDVARRALEAFLDVGKTRAGPWSVRVDALRTRLAEGPVAADLDAWYEVMWILPASAPGVFDKKSIASGAWEAAAAVLQPLEDTLDAATHSLRAAVLADAHRRFTAAKDAAGVRDFDDMIAQTRARLDDPGHGPAIVARIRGEIDTALIDEFQDTDPDQWAIFSRLFGDRRLILVGDPKQAIYSFRGADVFAYFGAHDAVDARATLDHNHRSHPQLVRAVNHLFGREPDVFVLDELDFESVEPAKKAADRAIEGDPGPAFQFSWLDAEAVGDTRVDAYRRAATQETVDEIGRLLARKPRVGEDDLTPGHVAVLTRFHAESRRVHEALRAAGIDAVIAGSGDIRLTEVYAELGHVLQAVLDPTDPRARNRALATRVWGGVVDDLLVLQQDAGRQSALVDTLDGLRRTWEMHGVFEVLARVLLDLNVEDRWLAEVDGERDVTDLRHALEFLHELERQRGLGPEALLDQLWLQRTRANDEKVDDATQLRLERDENAVKIVTVHASKGLEYDVVFVPFAWDGRPASTPWEFHEGHEFVVDWSEDEGEASRLAAAEKVAEEMRLLYVALTRASRRCVVVDTDFVAAKGQPARIAPLHHLLHRRPRRPDEAHEVWIDRLLNEMRTDREGWREHLDDVVEHDGIGWADVGPSAPGHRPDDSDHERQLEARPFPPRGRHALRAWSLTSFTQLARGSYVGETRLGERDDPASDEVVVDVEPAGIFAFARGAEAGNALHEVLEVSDFAADPGDPEHRRRVEAVLRRHGMLAAERHAAAIDPVDEAVALVARVADETFPTATASFAAIGARQRANEWEFRLPVDRIALSDLADLVDAHAPHEFATAFASRLRSHDGVREKGLFGGIVDLVFELDGCYRIVDWKSNHLGNTTDAYDPVSMHAAMLEHDYYLQLLLYQVALHRHLRVRRPGYDYEVHCGGAAYAFLRGLCGREDRGWIHWKPSKALVEAVDVFFDVPTVGGAR